MFRLALIVSAMLLIGLFQYTVANDEESDGITEEQWEESIQGYDYRQSEDDPIRAQPNVQPDMDGPSWFDSDIVGWAFMAILIAILLFVILRFVLPGIGRANPELERVGVEELQQAEENLSGANLEQLLERAIETGQFKVALRIYYLIILKELANKELLVLRKDATNHQYLRQLRKSDFYESFRLATYSFERFWYGDQNLQESEFKRLSVPMQAMINNLKKD